MYSTTLDISGLMPLASVFGAENITAEIVKIDHITGEFRVRFTGPSCEAVYQHISAMSWDVAAIESAIRSQ